MTRFPLLTLAVVLLPAASLRADDKPGIHWPSFRGPSASGVAEGFKTPAAWDVASGKNVAWSTPIKGLGLSSPVIWGDHIYITTAVGKKDDQELKVGLYGDIAPVEENQPYSFQVICINKKSGKIIWTKTAYKGIPKIKRHTKASHANSTPATDGKHVVAFFGSEGLYCYTSEGKLVWKKDFGTLDAGFYMMPEAQWGFGSSPVIDGDVVLVQCDVQKGSFLAALSLADGKELWRTPREEVPTWSSPTVARVGGKAQVVANGYKHIGGYDLATGKELWKLVGGGDIPVPTPVLHGNHAFITNAHGNMAPIYAVDLTAASGTITPPEESGQSNQYFGWWKKLDGIYMQTPLIVGKLAFFCRDNGVLTCFDVASGDRKFRKRLGNGNTGFTASGVSADGKLYFTSEEGEVYVVPAEENFAVMGINKLGAISMATPAISEGGLYFRTQKGLIAIREK